MNYPLFSRNDLSAFWALFADNLANLLIIAGVLLLFRSRGRSSEKDDSADQLDKNA